MTKSSKNPEKNEEWNMTLLCFGGGGGEEWL